ncbi:MAG: UDP-3-O-acyl-N-acetylglucosamine deacetylase [Pirellulaceae bacterium]
MNTTRPQQTVACAAQVSGYGYWGGKDVRVEFRPAPPNTGIVFVRSDLQPAIRIPALVENRIEIPRRTTLAANRAAVEMVEHVLAALAGLQIDNCEVWVDQAEMPGCDGSSEPFVAALLTGGIVSQDWPARQLIVTDVTRVGSDECWVEARPAKRGGLSIKYRLDYGSDNSIGKQTIELKVTPESFRRELAAARTFLLQNEAEWLRSRGLGGRVTPQDVLVFGDLGPIDNELRFEDECVRHKALDLIGDLALANCEIVGQIIAYRSGHRLNAELARVLLAEGQRIEPRRKSA